MTLKYLGTIGRDLPSLSEQEWKIIFEFIDLFVITDQIDNKVNFEQVFNWKKIHEILTLLGKIK